MGQLILDTDFKGYQVKIIVDSGATGNFISLRIIILLNLGTKVKI
jgi:hypothetical protein